MTRGSINPGGLQAYREALTVTTQSTNGSLSASDTDTTQVPAPTTGLSLEPDDSSRRQKPNDLLPTLSFPEAHSVGSHRFEETPSRISESMRERALSDAHSHLRPTHQIHEYCSDTSSCNYQSDFEHDKPPPRRGKRTGNHGAHSSDSEQDGGYDHIQAEAYDSDLDSVMSSNPGHEAHKKKMRKWKSLSKGRFENMLLDCIVDTDHIAPEYRDIFVARSTIERLEQVTSLSLRRPQAFSRGVLKSNKITGAVLYGPPGTGKSLLAKGIAKQSGFNMISVSTSEIWQKCHGEDEKMIKAVFSMARKLYPCLVFVDEADAMLGARKAGERRHVRAMLNQFLMEWDGLMSGLDAPFVLLATNRPFDLDPAVLRRAPVQIHLDVPTSKERNGILRLLLREEKVQGIDFETLANLTKGYTGSDLKNLCVAAATTCVNAQSEDTSDRILLKEHFLTARSTIRPTNISTVNTKEMKRFEDKSGQDQVGIGQREVEE